MQSKRSPRCILIIDAQPMFMRGLTVTLKEICAETVFETAATIADAQQVLSEKEIDLITLDIKLPDGDGINFCRQVRKANAAVKIIGIASPTDRHTIALMIEAGANGYVIKSADAEEICFAMQQVMKGKLFIHTIEKSEALKLSDHNSTTSLLKPITEREKEILKLICKGYTDARVSKELHIAFNTSRNHRHHLHFKTGTHNTAELVVFARDHALV